MVVKSKLITSMNDYSIIKGKLEYYFEEVKSRFLRIVALIDDYELPEMLELPNSVNVLPRGYFLYKGESFGGYTHIMKGGFCEIHYTNFEMRYLPYRNLTLSVYQYRSSKGNERLLLHTPQIRIGIRTIPSARTKMKLKYSRSELQGDFAVVDYIDSKDFCYYPYTTKKIWW